MWRSKLWRPRFNIGLNQSSKVSIVATPFCSRIFCHNSGNLHRPLTVQRGVAVLSAHSCGQRFWTLAVPLQVSSVSSKSDFMIPAVWIHSTAQDFAKKKTYSNFGHKARPVSKTTIIYYAFLGITFTLFFGFDM